MKIIYTITIETDEIDHDYDPRADHGTLCDLEDAALAGAGAHFNDGICVATVKVEL